MEGTRIGVKGIEWNYLEKGSGKSLLYIHGNTGCSVWWEKVMDVPGYRVISPDMPNFGLSSPLPGKPGIEAYADAMADFIIALGLKGTVAVGHSLGGAVCLSLAARRPELLGGLVLVDSSAPSGLKTPEAYHPAIEAMRMDRAVLAKALGAVAPLPGDPAFFQRLVDGAALMAVPAWIGNAVALSSFDVTGKLGGFTKPVLVIRGANDYLITDAMARETAAAFPGSRLETLEGLGHSPIVEDPARFLALLRPWLG